MCAVNAAMFVADLGRRTSVVLPAWLSEIDTDKFDKPIC
jgi:hypothetical protein